MKGIADSLRRRGHPCDKKKLAMLRFFFVFRNFLRMQAFCEVLKTKKSEATLHSFFVAERKGFEPPVLERVQRFSRPPHSTTLASLQSHLAQ